MDAEITSTQNLLDVTTCFRKVFIVSSGSSLADGRWQQWHHPWGPLLLSHCNDLGAVAACVSVTARKHAKAKRNGDKKGGSFFPPALLSGFGSEIGTWQLQVLVKKLLFFERKSKCDTVSAFSGWRHVCKIRSVIIGPVSKNCLYYFVISSEFLGTNGQRS